MEEEREGGIEGASAGASAAPGGRDNGGNPPSGFVDTFQERFKGFLAEVREMRGGTSGERRSMRGKDDEEKVGVAFPMDDALTGIGTPAQLALQQEEEGRRSVERQRDAEEERQQREWRRQQWDRLKGLPAQGADVINNHVREFRWACGAAMLGSAGYVALVSYRRGMRGFTSAAMVPPRYWGGGRRFSAKVAKIRREFPATEAPSQGGSEGRPITLLCEHITLARWLSRKRPRSLSPGGIPSADLLPLRLYGVRTAPGKGDEAEQWLREVLVDDNDKRVRVEVLYTQQQLVVQEEKAVGATAAGQAGGRGRDNARGDAEGGTQRGRGGGGGGGGGGGEGEGGEGGGGEVIVSVLHHRRGMATFPPFRSVNIAEEMVRRGLARVWALHERGEVPPGVRSTGSDDRRLLQGQREWEQRPNQLKLRRAVEAGAAVGARTLGAGAAAGAQTLGWGLWKVTAWVGRRLKEAAVSRGKHDNKKES